MITDEILEIVSDPSDDGSRLCAVTDEFRSGRDPIQILTLLDSENAELVSIGTFILNEIAFAIYKSQPFISRLHRLLLHPDSSVRFHALGALFPALDPSDETTRTLLRGLRRDRNESVRMRAEAAAARLGLADD